MALCVPSAWLGSFGLAPPDSFLVKGKEGVLLLPCSLSLSQMRLSVGTLVPHIYNIFFFFFLVEGLAVGTFHLA